MAEASFAALIVVPLVVLALMSNNLLRHAMTAAEMTEAARQRLAGLGMLLLYLVVLLSLSAIGFGVYHLIRVTAKP